MSDRGYRFGTWLDAWLVPVMAAAFIVVVAVVAAVTA
jgi:hypothetical protein